MGPPHGMGISMQYNTVVMLLPSNYISMLDYYLNLWPVQLYDVSYECCSLLQPMPSFQQPSKSTNPFDIGSDPPPILIPTVRDFDILK